MTKIKNILGPRHSWTDAQVAKLKLRYPNTKTKIIANELGLKVYQVYAKAKQLGLKKSQEYLDSPDACRLRRGDNVGSHARFPKGHTPWNKGSKGLQIGGAATQFKKGNRPNNWKPVGSERIADGYLQRKMTDTGYPPRDWVGVHILLWQEHHGPIPEAHAVVFKDGNKQNITIENLELISRRELMSRNTRHNLPKEINEVIQLRAALVRKVNHRAKKEAKA